MQSLETCPVKSAWSDYLEGAIDDDAFSTLTEHLTFCDRCVTVLDELSESISARGRSPFLDEENFKQLTLRMPAVGSDPHESLALQDIKQIDNFEIVRHLGAGSFGMVYLAIDCNLRREVVIKLPRVNGWKNTSQIDAMLVEARKSANLNHPNIVGVHHVGLWKGRPYLVQQFISGGDLRQSLKDRKFTFEEIAQLIAEVAEGVAFAHSHRIVHRDLKPSNILLEHSTGRALIADFGLAIHEDAQMGDIGRVAGTLPYMPPEQIRGETHRLDGRSDLWSIGVILYRMLANELPFRSSDPAQLRIEICQKLARPPRQIDSTIPSELERICLKCLAIRMTDRYNTAQDLADDLRHWLLTRTNVIPYFKDHVGNELQNGSNDRATEQLIPKGLLAFDGKDCRFFLELLPGPKTRDGIPEQIRYWLNRTASQKGVKSFAVGLIYGPSGCGKTSFILAGLIPLMPKNVICVYCEATDRDFEAAIVLAIRRRIPQIPESLNLIELLKGLRTGQWLGDDERLLLVLDQFEQWLHGNEVLTSSPLIEALRHCDGLRSQAIVLARDDFWMRVSRFFNELEIELAERDNFQPLYLFDENHAKKVLVLFGMAYGKFSDSGQLSDEQQRFVDEATRLLNDRGKIICVRLILFVETLKAKAWTIETLNQIGSIHSIGAIFLEESFNSSRANPNARFHRDAICAILRRMLPEADTNIKARLRERSHLALASGFDEDSKEFRLMMDILEKQMRLISPSVPSVGESALDDSALKGDRFYQLTHDFLVPAVRDWLFRIDSQSPSGRARSRLEALSSAFTQSNDKRFLPKFLEFIAIARYLRPSQLDPDSRKLYWKAATKYVSRAMFSLLAFTFFAVAWNANHYALRQRIADTKTRHWLTILRQGNAIPIDFLEEDISVNRASLLEKESTTPLTETEQSNIDLAQVLLGNVQNFRLERLIRSVDHSGFARMKLVREALASHKRFSVEMLKNRYALAKSVDERLRIAIVLFHLGIAGPIEMCLQNRSDAFEFEFAVQFIAEDQDSVTDYLQLLSEKVELYSSHDALSGIVLGLTNRSDTIASNPITANEWHRLLKQLYLESKSAPMHSAAEFALRNSALENSELTRVRDIQIPSDRNWFVAPNGLTFAKIPTNSKEVRIAIKKWVDGPSIELPQLQDFWISTTEVNRRLFCEYLDDTRNNKDIPSAQSEPNPNLPIKSVLISDAMAFCNWLSIRDGLTPWYSAVVDQMTGDSSATSPVKVETRDFQWEVKKFATGYRLPNLAEALFASQGERQTALPIRRNDHFPFTADVRNLAIKHGWFDENAASKQLPIECGKLWPNFHGLFDIYGNVSELTIDTRNEKVESEQFAIQSDLSVSLDKLVGTQLSSCFMKAMPPLIGFRVVRIRN